MAIPSIVPYKKVKNDPRQLVYHFPSIPNVKMSKILNSYFYHRSVQIGEEVAAITGYIFLPATCMHWRRKEQYIDRRVRVSNSYFYVLKEGEMTRTEKERYKEMLAAARGDPS